MSVLVQDRDGGDGRVEEVQDVDGVVGEARVVEPEGVPEDVVPGRADWGLPEGVEADGPGWDRGWLRVCHLGRMLRGGDGGAGRVCCRAVPGPGYLKMLLGERLSGGAARAQ